MLLKQIESEEVPSSRVSALENQGQDGIQIEEKFNNSRRTKRANRLIRMGELSRAASCLTQRDKPRITQSVIKTL